MKLLLSMRLLLCGYLVWASMLRRYSCSLLAWSGLTRLSVRRHKARCCQAMRAALIVRLGAKIHAESWIEPKRRYTISARACKSLGLPLPLDPRPPHSVLCNYKAQSRYLLEPLILRRRPGVGQVVSSKMGSPLSLDPDTHSNIIHSSRRQK